MWNVKPLQLRNGENERKKGYAIPEEHSEISYIVYSKNERQLFVAQLLRKIGV